MAFSHSARKSGAGLRLTADSKIRSSPDTSDPYLSRAVTELTADPLSSPVFEGIVLQAKEKPRPWRFPLNKTDRNAADDWIRDNMLNPAEYSFEDTEEAGSTESYFFLRYRDSATVVYNVAVKDGKVTSVLQEVYHGEGSQEEPDEQRWLVKPQGQERKGRKRKGRR